jgi:signal transduction histidine kinase/CheY-like chemotaxis protein/HAMP domain-containing protein
MDLPGGDDASPVTALETVPRGKNGNGAHGDDRVPVVGSLLRALRIYKRGDFSVRMPLDLTGEAGEIALAFNDVVERSEALEREIARLNVAVGKDGRLSQRANVGDVSGQWRTCVDSLNGMIDDLSQPTTEAGRVMRAVAAGNLELKMSLDNDGRPLKGDFLRTALAVNGMVDRLKSFASEVTRVAREVGTEGNLGGQAVVEGVAGTWKDLTDNVNSMASNLTSQVRNIAEVTTAVATGDLSKTITVDARGEILELKKTVNTMVDQLNAFASEVSRVAREVGNEGRLGGQAEVPGAAGTWRNVVDRVNQLAGNLTTQVRAIGDVATAVTKGDLTRSITVEASGEVAALKDDINEMIRALRETTQKTTEQDWLKTNLARFTRMLQGQRDLVTVAQQVLSELAPLVEAQHGVFYIAVKPAYQEVSLELLASYGIKQRRRVPKRFAVGEGLVGQCAAEKRRIRVEDVPAEYMQITSGLGSAAPRDLLVLPVLFEGQVNAVIELASFSRFSEIHCVFLDQLTESIGIVVNTISASMRTEALLQQSQSLTRELQVQQEELRTTNERLEHQATTLRESEERLRTQQDKLQQTNEQLEEKAKQLELKNREVGFAKREVEEQAEQLALTSKYKSQFLANMSHELRTPLNSLLILSKMLSENLEGNLLIKQVEFARTIHAAGTDLLVLINDILDLSKIESGTMTVDVSEVFFSDLRDYVEQSFRHVAEQKGLKLTIELDPSLPRSMHTDMKRLQQVLKNLVSNALKFTERGTVSLRPKLASGGWGRDVDSLNAADRVIAFEVRDTGIGIAEDKQRIIFEAFQQADGTTSRKYGGTGLGLSISRELARLLGGEVRVASAPGAGSSFTLYLPATYMPAPERVMGSATPLSGTPAVDLDNGPPTWRPHDDSSDTPSWANLDDREQIRKGDRVLLIVEDDDSFARILLDAAHERGWRVVVASEGVHAMHLARRMAPSAIWLDLHLPDTDGRVLLDQLKHDRTLRSIPVEVVSGSEAASRAARGLGARGFLTKPVTREQVFESLDALAAFIDEPHRAVLVVADDENRRHEVLALLETEDVACTAVADADEAMAALGGVHFSAAVVDLSLAGRAAFALLERARRVRELARLPFVLYAPNGYGSDHERSAVHASELLLREAQSYGEVLDLVTLFLHTPDDVLSERQREALAQLERVGALGGTTVLVIDDDVRNIFAVTSALERQNARVLYAEGGAEGLALLERSPGVDVVLTDIMMPELDGYEVMRRIRNQRRFSRMPIIAVTAKAMKTDRDKCIAAGASDYIAKPVDVAKLVSMIRVSKHGGWEGG